MFCPNCGFEIKDPGITTCPECSCILSQNIPESDEDEELFEDIDKILSSEDLGIDDTLKAGDTDLMKAESPDPEARVENNFKAPDNDITEKDIIEGPGFGTLEGLAGDEEPAAIPEFMPDATRRRGFRKKSKGFGRFPAEIRRDGNQS